MEVLTDYWIYRKTPKIKRARTGIKLILWSDFFYKFVKRPFETFKPMGLFSGFYGILIYIHR